MERIDGLKSQSCDYLFEIRCMYSIWRVSVRFSCAHPSQCLFVVRMRDTLPAIFVRVCACEYVFVCACLCSINSMYCSSAK